VKPEDVVGKNNPQRLAQVVMLSQNQIYSEMGPDDKRQNILRRLMLSMML
jgi:hypothetical protein